uniref:Uncharacterized protein n=1 Tax=Brassica oleracea var. oleracea TaxID=109376 RepID=A0A0D3BGF1_BRAOL
MNTGLKVRYQRIKRNLKPPYKKDSEKDSLWMHTTKQQKFLRELDPNRVLSNNMVEKLFPVSNTA